MSEVAGSFELTYCENLAGCVWCHIDTFHTEESSCSLKILVDSLPGSASAIIISVLENIIASRYFDKLIPKLFTEPDAPGLSGFHFLDTESLFEYI